MSEKNPIRVFVTHVFTEHPDYLRVFEYLESTPNFFYLNCSDIGKIPSVGGKEAVKTELRTQMTNAEIVIVISSMFSENRDLMAYQLDAAQALGLPIVSLEPFGGGNVPEDVSGRSAETIDWNERTMVDAIRRQARHEETSRWEVIEFDMS